MKQISIRPTWTIQDPDGPPMSPRLIELLVQVHASGSLATAAREQGLSYRHAWDLVRQGEAHFKAPLLHMARGKGSTLTALGEKIVWADHRILARLKPALDSLASELAAELHRTLSDEAPLLRLHASHGFAIERLIDHLGAGGLRPELTYASASAAVAALHDGDADLAGLHLPIGPLEGELLAHYARWLPDEDLTVIDIARRRLGLMVRAGNPQEVFRLRDLARPGVRFINRQSGSGTRLLLEALLRQEGVDPAGIAGFEQGEFTHAAVAAYVASGMADVGFGLEPPARQFRLDFIPVISERYFLLCRTAATQTPAVARVIAALRDPVFVGQLAALPGYDPADCGRTSHWTQAFDATDR